MTYNASIDDGKLYVNEGRVDKEGSSRFYIDEYSKVVVVEKLVNGLWQPASFETGPNSVWVGHNVGIAGVGHHLATESSDGHLHFHAHSEYDDNTGLTTSDVQVLNAYNYVENLPFNPDQSNEWSGTQFDYIESQVPFHALIHDATFKTGASAPLAPVRIEVYEDGVDTGTKIFSQLFSHEGWGIEDEQRIKLEGHLEFNAGMTYLIRFSSDETFSMKVNAAGDEPYFLADTSFVVEENLLQTIPYYSGGTYDEGQLLIHERQIYVCTVTGIQTGTFEDNADKWDLIHSTYVEGGGFTEGSIPFASSNGKLTQDNAHLSWDDVTDKLNIGGQALLEGNLVSKQSDGVYVGRTRISESHWKSSPTINDWEATESARDWKKVAVSSDTQYISAVVDNGNYYTSDDYGVSWTERDSDRAWRDVAISSDGQYQTAVVNGGQIYKSSNYGVTRTQKDSVRNWLSVGMSSTGQYQTAGTSDGDIYVSSDYGETWSLRSKNGSMACVAVSSTGQYQAVGAAGQTIYVSSDYGVNFSGKSTIWNWTGIDMSANGKYMTAVADSERVWVSSDYGNNWDYHEDTYRDYTDVSMSSDGQYQTAVVNGGKIYVSENYGKGWFKNDEVNRDWTGIALSSGAEIQVGTVTSGNIYIQQSNFITLTRVIDPDPWTQIAISSDGKYQTAVKRGGPIQISSDYGITWAITTSETKSWTGIAMSSDGKYQTATASYGDIYTSDDYGVTWVAAGEGGLSRSNVDMSSDGRVQVTVCGGDGNPEYIYISYDYGQTWNQKGISSYWQRVACSSDGKYITATSTENNLYRSTDYGETWASVGGSFLWEGIAMSSDGKYQTAANHDTNKSIYVSSNYGSTFSQKGNDGDYVAVAMSSDGKYQIAAQTTYEVSYSLFLSDDYGQTWTLLYGTSASEKSDIKMSSDGKYIIVSNDGGGIFTHQYDTVIQGNVVIDDLTANVITADDITAENVNINELEFGNLIGDDIITGDLFVLNNATIDNLDVNIINDGITIHKNVDPFIEFIVDETSAGRIQGWSDKIAITDPEGINIHFDVDTGAGTVNCYDELYVGEDIYATGNLTANKLYLNDSGSDYIDWDSGSDWFRFSAGLDAPSINVSELYATTIAITSADISSYLETPLIRNSAGDTVTIEDNLAVDGSITAGGNTVLTSADPAGSITNAGSTLVVTDTERTNWNTAYNWGDHETETDPVFTAWDKSSGILIAGSQLEGFTDGKVPFGSGFGGLNVDNLFEWDNANKRLAINKINPTSTLDVEGTIKATAMKVNNVNVLTSYTETDPIFTAWDKSVTDLLGDGTLQFENTTGVKINLYSDTYSLGVESSELRIASGPGAMTTFYTGGYSGSEVARIESDGMLKVTGGVRAPEFWSTGLLKIQPDAQGDVEFFGDTDVGNVENGKILKIWRRAPEGNDYIRFYVSQSRNAYIHASRPLTLQAQVAFTINSVTDNIVFKVGDSAGAKKIYFRNSDNDTLISIDSTGQMILDANMGASLNVVRGSNNTIKTFLDSTYTDLRFEGTKEYNRIGTWIDKPFQIVTNSIDRIVVTSDGKVGINRDATIQLPLEVESADDNQIMVIDSSPQAEGVGGGIAFGAVYNDAGDEAMVARIEAEKPDSVSGSLGFNLALESQDTSGVLAQRMIFTSDGRCGINVDRFSSPNKTLDVWGDTRVRGDLTVDDAINGTILHEDGDLNIFLGEEIPSNIGGSNISIGTGNMTSLTSDDAHYNIVIGTNVMPTLEGNSDKNIGIGTTIMTGLTLATDSNIVMGHNLAMSNCENASDNIVIGHSSVDDVNSFLDNVLFGTNIARSATNMSRCTILGKSAGSSANNTLNDVILLGYSCNVPSGETTDYMNLGNEIHANTDDHYVAITRTTAKPSGPERLWVDGDTKISGGLEVTGDINNMAFEEDSVGNVYIGTPIPAGIGTGSGNIVLGDITLINLTDGDSNLVLGASSGRGITDGYFNIILGSESGNDVGVSTSIDDNNILIGYTTETVNGRSSNSLNIGNAIWGNLSLGHIRIGGGQGTALKDSAALEVKSTTGAFLMPRMNETERNALTGVNGMMIYCTTYNQVQFYENGSWRRID
jgi:hypothetical protein